MSAARRGGRFLVGATIFCACAVAFVLAQASPAVAVVEPITPAGGCGPCHQATTRPCTDCHEYPINFGDALNWWDNVYTYRGPHGLYSTATDRCRMCHTLHDAPTSFKMLPGATVQATCFFCHDGTGGQGVYGTIVKRGLSVGGGHSVDMTNVIPGGDGATGGNSSVTFRGPGSTMTCSDCHSPHDSATVAKFMGERVRVAGNEGSPPGPSTKLLKRRPTGAASETVDYGSDWCMTCHRGRHSGGTVINHPVESKVTTANPYTYDRVPLNKTYNQSSYWAGASTLANDVVIGTLGGVFGGAMAHSSLIGPSVSGYYSSAWEADGWLMKYPRPALQQGHGPICQQCHEDSRNCGYLTADGSQAYLQPDWVPNQNIDGVTATLPAANPRFQNFPHETQNANLLLETGDNLCNNCHPPAVLP